VAEGKKNEDGEKEVNDVQKYSLIIVDPKAVIKIRAEINEI
jgi:hypothetical protein